MHPELVTTTQGVMVRMPADAAGHRELISVNAAHARMQELLSAEDCEQSQCLGCQLTDLLQGLR